MESSMNKHRRKLRVMFCSAALIALGAAPLAAGAAEKPNIVIILSDDQGYADVSYHPHSPPEVSTPGIDRLAAAGVVFTDGYVTAPNCAPTRAALLTGRYQQRFGLYEPGDSRVGLPTDEITLADVLRGLGYATGCFGKWHLGIERPYNPVERGFDEFYGFLGHGGRDYFDLTIDPENLHQAVRRGHEPINDQGYFTDRITDEAIDFIERHHERRFFAYVAYSAPHYPMQAPAEYVAKYDTGDPIRDIYLAMVDVMDEGIGRIIDTLQQKGVYENTLIFFLSDNGGARANSADNTPLRGFKQEMHDGGIRVPFVVAWPAQLEGGRIRDVPVICMDIFTTAVEAAGGQVPDDRIIDGRNLLPVAAGKADKLHERLFWSQNRGEQEHWAIREGTWKLVTNRGQPGLFDIVRDIGEQNDQADQQRTLAERLERMYRRWLEPMPPSLRHGRLEEMTEDANPKRLEVPKVLEHLTPRERLREERRLEKRNRRGMTNVIEARLPN
jgi:arylsulfatase A-like enzyme